MRLEVKKYLYDVEQAADLLTQFIVGKQFADYESDPMLRAAVERVHGYAQVDDRLVWDIVENKLLTLRREVRELLGDR